MRQLAVFAAALSIATISCGRSPSPVASPTTTSPTSSIQPAQRLVETTTTPPPEPTPNATDLTTLRLPDSGVVLAYMSGAGVGATSGVLLVDLKGNLLADIPGGLMLGDDTAGPLLIRSSDDYLLEPADGRLQKLPRSDDSRLPLAYGATLVHRGERDPGSNSVEINGKSILELGNRMGATNFVVSNDRDLITLLDNDTSSIFDLRTMTRRTIPSDCEASDRHGSNTLLLCRTTGASPNTVKVQRGSDLRTLFAPVSATGHWRKAIYSNDGASVLLQWSGECEIPSVYIGTAANQSRRQIPAPDVVALAAGWTEQNEAVVLVPSEPGCGDDQDISGLHLAPTVGKDTRAFAAPPGKELSDVRIWMRLPR